MKSVHVIATTFALLVASEHATAEQTAHPFVIVDGSLNEWQNQGIRDVAFADEEHLYLRVRTDRVMNLQANDQRVQIWLDIDGSAATGYSRELLGSSVSSGADVEIEFSPKPRSLGVAVWHVDDDGKRTRIIPSRIGLIHAPTYAAKEFEIRLLRRPAGIGDQQVDESGQLTSWRSVRGAISVPSDLKKDSSRLDTFLIRTPPPRAPRRTSEIVAQRDTDAVRIVSYNVRNTSLLENPEPFTRIFNALNPDIILIQEWRKGDAATVRQWFDDRMPRSTSWHVSQVTKRGEVIVSRRPLEHAIGSSKDVYIGTDVHTTVGRVGIVNLHLTCCGTLDSDEDRARVAQATELNRALRKMDRGILVVGGDVNLVGSRRPLDILRSHADADGTDLAVARTMVMGDSAIYTWRHPEKVFAPDNLYFPPGRHDYIVYSDSTAEMRQSFVLDTAILSDAALDAAGLRRSDSLASDHLPVIIDVVPRK